MVIQKRANRIIGLPTGIYARHELSGFTNDTVTEGDEIIDSFSNYYEIESIATIDVLDNFLCYECELVKLPIHYDMPTYGTGATVDDPRERTKTWLDTHITAANLKENDGSTNASYITCWANPPYPIRLVFVSKGVDLVFSIGRTNSTLLIDSTHYVIGYEEKISIFPSAIDKLGISGENLMWQGERELRRIAENHPLGSLRNFETMNPKTTSLGSLTLYSVECVLNYERDKT